MFLIFLENLFFVPSCLATKLGMCLANLQVADTHTKAGAMNKDLW